MHIFHERTLKLGDIIAMHRRTLGWTQEQLAEYLGITKASVSKWETGQTHPDILLLPDLATLFNITIDELLNYQSQLSKKQIVFLYRNLLEIKERKGLTSALDKIQFYRRKYGSCAEFLLSLIQWLLNAATLTVDEKEKELCFQEALHLTSEVHRISKDPSDLNQAVAMEAVIHMMRGQFPLVIEMCQQVLAPERFALDELYLNALLADGKKDKAEETGQILLFMHLNSILSLLTANMALLMHDNRRFKKLVQFGNQIIQTLNLNTIPTNPVFAFYLQTTACYCQKGETELALKALADYTKIVEKITFPITIKGNNFFNKIDPWVAKHLVLAENAPVDDATVRKNILASVVRNPLFQSLQDEQKFQEIIIRLKKKLEVAKC